MPGSSTFRADSPISDIIHVQDYKDDPKRTISNITATSVSSFPDSALPSDSDVPSPFYSSAKPRPAYRVGSLRRSPLPAERLSPSLRPPKHSSRRPRSRGEDSHHGVEQDSQPAPLVLLHVTVLPPRLPWNRSVLDAILGPELKSQFGLVRAQTSGLVAHRGILIAHPRDEFELLEEGVLEALDLLPERIGLDGQYRPRTPSTIVEDGADDEEAEEAESSTCNICQRVHDVGEGWHTRVYAANGLMRSGAWSACWSEMERVDVEVLPCISQEVRRALDDMQTAEEAAGEHKQPSPAIQPSQAMQTTETPSLHMQLAILPAPAPRTTEQQHQQMQPISPQRVKQRPASQHHDLPPIYRPKDIPLSLLLRNYVYLLLCDRRNLAILFLMLTLLASTFQGMLISHGSRRYDVAAFRGELQVFSDIQPMEVASSNGVESMMKDRISFERPNENEHVVEGVKFTGEVEAENLIHSDLRASASNPTIEDFLLVTAAQASTPTAIENVLNVSGPSISSSVPETTPNTAPEDIAAAVDSTKSPNPAYIPRLYGARGFCKSWT